VLESGEGIAIKLIDFGIAKRLVSSELETAYTGIATRTNDILGTAYYISPEQLVSPKHVDHRADLWSLAVVAYKALTGHSLFINGMDGAEMLLSFYYKEMEERAIPPPTAFRPELPTTVDTWMARALHRDLASRFGTAQEKAEAFELAANATAEPPPAQ
jgi:eukaryotic-like serine/threonine-protein kinase